MTTPTTPAQARELADDFENIDHWHLTGVKLQHGAEILRSLAQQFEALTADLAAEKLFSKQAMESVTEIAVQRDALKTENANLLAANRYSQNVEQEAMSDLMAMTVERDGLQQAVIDRDSITRGLLERIDALKPDAELYRHLRDHFAKNLENAREGFARLEPLTGAAFDAAVRASMDLMGAAS